MKFFLKAEPNFKGQLRIKEWFELSDGKLYQGGDGLWVERPTVGHIDDSVRQAYANEYNAWRTYVDEHDSELYAEAREEYMKEHPEYGQLG